MVQITGLCRFSYPTGAGTGFTRKIDPYDPERLERRLQYFAAVCLPPLRKQTDPDFTLLVLVGEGLPPPVMDRLKALLADLPQAVLCIEPDGQRHIPLCNRLLLQHRNPEAEVVAEFCMDDDDAVAVDFVRKLRRRVRQARALWATGSVLEIDFVNGFVLRTGHDTPLLAVSVAHWTPAQAFVFRQGLPQTAFGRNHFLNWKRSTGLSLSDQMMFIRSLHFENDSNISENAILGLAHAEQPGDIDAVLRTRFGIDPAAIAALPQFRAEQPGLTQA